MAGLSHLQLINNADQAARTKEPGIFKGNISAQEYQQLSSDFRKAEPNHRSPGVSITLNLLRARHPELADALGRGMSYPQYQALLSR